MKALLILSALASLALTSCSSVLAYMASPAGQVTTAAATTLAKNLAKAGEASVLRKSIDMMLVQIATYEAQPLPSGIPAQFLLAAKIDGLKAAVIAAQQQYKGLTGRDYPELTSGK